MKKSAFVVVGIQMTLRQRLVVVFLLVATHSMLFGAEHDNLPIYPFRQQFSFWSGNLLGQNKTQFSMTFFGISYRSPKELFSDDSFEKAPFGKKYVRVHYSLTNLGPRIGSPSFSKVEIKTEKGYIYKYDMWKSAAGDFGNFEQESTKECYFTFLIPLNEKPINLSFRAGGQSFAVDFPDDIPRVPTIIRGACNINDRQLVKILDHYLNKEEGNRLNVGFKNISKDYLYTYVRMEFLDKDFHLYCRLHEMQNVPPGTEAFLTYDFDIYPDPSVINSYSINIMAFHSPRSLSDIVPLIGPLEDVCPDAQIVYQNVYEPSRIEKTNLTLNDIKLLGENVLAVLSAERKQGKIDNTLEARASMMLIDLITIADVYNSDVPFVDDFIEQQFYSKKFPDLIQIYRFIFEGYPVKIIPPIDAIDVAVEDAQEGMRSILIDLICDYGISNGFISSNISALTEEISEYGMKWFVNKFKVGKVGFLEIYHPVVGRMQIIYRKDEGVAYANFDMTEIVKDAKTLAPQRHFVIIAPISNDPLSAADNDHYKFEFLMHP